MKTSKICFVCQKAFLTKYKYSKLQIENAKFCSLQCSYENKKGKPLNIEHKAKIVATRCKNGNGNYHSEKTRNKISISLRGKRNPNFGKPHSDEWKTKVSIALMGKKRLPFSEECRRKMSIAHMGEKTHLWRGGITSIVRAIRNSLEYRFWRESVFKRDNWTCVWCFQKGGKLNADHIKPFVLFPELRLALDNGRTLCINCHRKTDTWGEKAKKESGANGVASGMEKKSCLSK